MRCDTSPSSALGIREGKGRIGINGNEKMTIFFCGKWDLEGFLFLFEVSLTMHVMIDLQHFFNHSWL